MPSSLNTKALHSLLESDSLDLEKLLESLDISASTGLSKDDLLTALLEGLAASNLTDNASFADIAQTLYDLANTGDRSASTAIPTLLETAGNQPGGLNKFIDVLAQSLNRPTSTTAIFSFANSIFSDRFSADSQYGNRIQPFLRKAAAAYQSFIPTDAAAFSTVARNGNRLNNGQGNAQSLKWTNKSNGNTNISFAFDNDFAVNGLSFDRAKSLVISALGVWSQYAPLNFQEIQDPGDKDSVDIYVQSDGIDGSGGTLAFAYFPTFGDITFDNGESWNDSKFLETAVHELGHSLGLGHESDVSAIMNPVLNDRFAGSTDPFLLQDDINGIRYLYGSGSGNISTLGNGTPQPEISVNQIANNLVVNGSFENTPVEANSVGGYKSIQGWKTLSGVGFQVDKRTQSISKAADGSAWVELDAYGANTTIYQNIDTLTGQDYTLSVDFTANGKNKNSTAVEVFWEGKRVDKLTGGGRNKWKSYNFRVTGGDRKVSTLAFRSAGAVDDVGGLLDNVSVLARANATAAPEGHVCGPSCGSHCIHHGHSHKPGNGHSHGHSHGNVAAAYKLGQFDVSSLSSNILSSADAAPELMASQPTQIFPDTAIAI